MIEKKCYLVSGNLSVHAYRRRRFRCPTWSAYAISCWAWQQRPKIWVKILAHYFPVPPGLASAILAFHHSILDGFRQNPSQAISTEERFQGIAELSVVRVARSAWVRRKAKGLFVPLVSLWRCLVHWRCRPKPLQPSRRSSQTTF